VLRGPDRSTFVEAAGIVPPERRANEDDMARVWLLCYVSDRSPLLDPAAKIVCDTS